MSPDHGDRFTASFGDRCDRGLKGLRVPANNRDPRPFAREPLGDSTAEAAAAARYEARLVRCNLINDSSEIPYCTFGQISCFSLLRSSIDFSVGVPLNGGHSIGIVKPASR